MAVCSVLGSLLMLSPRVREKRHRPILPRTLATGTFSGPVVLWSSLEGVIAPRSTIPPLYWPLSTPGWAEATNGPTCVHNQPMRIDSGDSRFGFIPWEIKRKENISILGICAELVFLPNYVCRQGEGRVNRKIYGLTRTQVSRALVWQGLE